MNKFDLMQQAINEARHTQRAVRTQIVAMTNIIISDGHLRSCSSHQLRQLKKQLRHFNMTTGAWNE